MSRVSSSRRGGESSSLQAAERLPAAPAPTYDLLGRRAGGRGRIEDHALDRGVATRLTGALTVRAVPARRPRPATGPDSRTRDAVADFQAFGPISRTSQACQPMTDATRPFDATATAARPRVTHAMEDYLKAVYRLADSGAAVTTQRLADELGVTPASVTNMIKRLDDLTLLTHTRTRTWP
jgi:hypothetical protein